MRTHVAAAAFITLALTGCVGSGAVEWEQRWKDRGGSEVPPGVVASNRGAEHCEWESTIFLDVGWPLGTHAQSVARAREYVRDAEGEFESYLRGRYDADAELPGDARYTGYHLDAVELWMSPSDSSRAAYLVYPDHVERWPRTANSFIACE